MAISRIDSTEFLNINKLLPGEVKEHIAYLQRATIGTDRSSSAFASFYLKDENGQQIIGRKFQLNSFDNLGFELSTLRNSPVKLTYYADNWQGQVTLRVEKIEKYTGEFPYGRFLGNYDKAEDSLAYINKLLSTHSPEAEQFPTSYLGKNYITICGGITGGYIKFMRGVFGMLAGYSGMPGVELSELLQVAVSVFKLHADYLEVQERFDVTPTGEYFRMVETYSKTLADNRLRNIAADAMSAVMGLTDPQHLYSHIISGSLLKTMELFKLSYSYPLVAQGSVKVEGELKLARY